ncbi:MAG: hypothetical protein ICV54_29620, partial [Nostoc sp. C3-bin3]|nr:hypothetical protein [Nostoc sp. C3-bin3]
MITSQLHRNTKKSSDTLPFFKTTSRTNALDSRLFVMQTKLANSTDKPDLKTSFKQAKKYGHNPNQILPTDISSNATPIQQKMGMEQSQVIQAAFKLPWRKKTPKTLYRIDERKPDQIVASNGFKPLKQNGNITIEEHV